MCGGFFFGLGLPGGARKALSVSLRSTAPLLRGASGEEGKLLVFAKASPMRGGGTPQA